MCKKRKQKTKNKRKHPPPLKKILKYLFPVKKKCWPMGKHCPTLKVKWLIPYTCKLIFFIVIYFLKTRF